MTNRYSYNPPFTREQLFYYYNNRMMSQVEIAEMFHTTQRVVQRAMKNFGIQARKAAPRDQRGDHNRNWRGGRVLEGTKGYSDKGYWYTYVPNHPKANKRGYVAEHILVATQYAGRDLKPGELVHHINLKKRQNTPENLIIVDHARHGFLHNQLEKIAVQLMERGMITFDPENGYMLVE